MNPLARMADRYKTLLRVNEIALSRSATAEIFQGMCAVLKELLAYDRAGLTLYDPDHDSLRIEALYGSYENSVFRVGYLLPRKSSQNGWTFEHQTQTIRRDLAEEARFPSEKHTLDDGYRSLCSVPLIVRNNSIGVVTIVGARKNQFSVRHAQLVQEVSNQIALAIVSIVASCPTHTNTKLELVS
jgi:formate hydrogenlyase transcriptional activator